MDETFIRNRITELRMKKEVSEYKMSLDLGHSKSYVQSITSGRALPSMTEFLYMCDYLGITPKDFFDEKSQNPMLIQIALEGMKELSDRDLQLLLEMIARLTEDKEIERK